MEMPENWSEVDGKLARIFTCQNFTAALTLVNKIGSIAEQLQHHPDIAVQNYNEVVVTTITHEANAITEKDYELAQKINSLL